MAAVLRSLVFVRQPYGQSPDALAQALPSIGDGFAATLRRLGNDTSIAGAAEALTQLEGIRQHLVRLSAALIREVAQ